MDATIYILRVVLYTGLFWAVFRVFLARNKRHGLNRAFLWVAILLPFFLPLITWPLRDAGTAATVLALPELVVSKTRNLGTGAAKYASWLLAGYVLTAVCLLIRTVIRHVTLQRLLGRSSFFTREGVRIYTRTGLGPGSYRTMIFLPTEETDENIVKHELAHITQRHHYDLLGLQLLKIICWPNLFLHALAADLKMIHEYQADEMAAGADVDPYVFRLLDEVMGTRQYSIAHSFFHQSIKNRIIMLQQKTTSQTGKGRWALVAGVTVAMTIGTIWVQSCSLKKDTATEVKAVASVEQKPAFKGDLYQWLGANMKYPETARLQQKEGRVVIGFIVDKDGDVKEPKVDISSGVKELDEEAMRIVRSMPQWTPATDHGKSVAVAYALPVTFKLG